MIYTYSCDVCGDYFEKYNSIKDKYAAFCCGQRAQKHIATDIQVNDDLMYAFEGEFRGEKVNIRSRKHYKDILKEKGLVDVTVPEVKSIRAKQENIKGKHDLNKLSDRIQRRVAKDGLTKHLNPLLEKCSTKQ